MQKNISIAISCDHAGYEIKEYLRKYLDDKEFIFKDFGTFSTDACDYPDYVHKMAKSIENNKYKYGLSLCGSGNGVAMVANKYKSIRAAVCWNTELVELARKHNDANVCVIPTRFITQEEALKIVKKFLNTDFVGGRHKKRVEKIAIK